MNVGALMSRDVFTCSVYDSLNEAARIMWEHDCGCVPVVDARGKVVAMVTDRDICMAAYTQGRPLYAIGVSTCASKKLVAVHEGDDLDDAEALMKEHQIRRVPVIDSNGYPIGILSVGDLARNARVLVDDQSELCGDAIASTLAAVSEPSHEREAA